MKNSLKNILILFLTVIVLIIVVKVYRTYNKSSQELVQTYQCPMLCEGDKIYETKEKCPVCGMHLMPIENNLEAIVANTAISETSIFNLTSSWKTEEDKTIVLKNLKGKTLVMVMIYTSCKAACPRLIADMRNIEAEIPKEKLKNIQFVFVSIDPAADTPKKLKDFAIENAMDGNQWTFLQGNVSSVREFANVLSVKYKEISPLDFSHSNIISVFDAQGELIHQQEGLGVSNKETMDAILKVTP